MDQGNDARLHIPDEASKVLTGTGEENLRVQILLSCLWLAGALMTAGAASVPTDVLLAPASFSNPSLSPDGKRIAVVIATGHDQRALLIAALGTGTLEPLMKTTVPGLVSVDHYEWVSSEVLLLWINVGAGDGDVWAVLDTRSRVLVQMHHEGARLIRTHWGDAEHVLIYDGCEHDQLCLYNWNIRLNTGLPVAKPVAISPSFGFDVVGANEIVTRAGGSDGQRPLRWNSGSKNWEPYTPPTPSEQAAGTDGFAVARARLAELDVATAQGAILFTSGSHQAVGVAVPTAPGLHALHPELEAPALAIGKQLHGQQPRWIDVSDDLSTALIGAHEPGAPETFYLWNRAGGLLTLQSSRPELLGAHLQPVHVMNNWLDDGAAVSVVLPAAGVPHGPMLIRTLIAPDEIARFQSADYDGAVQALAQHGLTIITVPVAAGDGGPQGAAWRQWATARVQRVAERAVQMGLGTSDRICLWGENLGGYAALAASALAPHPGYACVATVGVPMRFDSFSKPLYTTEGERHRTFFVSEHLVETLHSLWASGKGADPSAGNPVVWSAQLPTTVFLAYRTYSGELGLALEGEAAPFESALKSTGKHLTFYAPEAHFDDASKWNAALYEALATSALQAAPPQQH